MKVAVFSDIHGNVMALEAVLAALSHDSIDQLVCLGDAIQGGPQPAQVVARLRELGCPVVMGNADDWLIKGAESTAAPVEESRRQKMEDIRQWQLAQLSNEDKAFIHSFQATVELPLENGQTLCCYHGSPASFDDIILPTTPDDEVGQFLQPQQDMIYTGGHTHVQFIRHFDRTFHFNPGSVGFAYRHDQPQDAFRLDPWAEFAILSVTRSSLDLSFHRISYDVEGLKDVYRRSGRPYRDEVIEQYSR